MVTARFVLSGLAAENARAFSEAQAVSPATLPNVIAPEISKEIKR